MYIRTPSTVTTEPMSLEGSSTMRSPLVPSNRLMRPCATVLMPRRAYVKTSHQRGRKDGVARILIAPCCPLSRRAAVRPHVLLDQRPVRRPSLLSFLNRDEPSTCKAFRERSSHLDIIRVAAVEYHFSACAEPLQGSRRQQSCWARTPLPRSAHPPPYLRRWSRRRVRWSVRRSRPRPQ
jgi:hypothetical protein